MKNILISFILFLISNTPMAQNLPENRPSCTQGNINFLIVGDKSSARERSLRVFRDILIERNISSPLFGFFVNPLRVRVSSEYLQLDLDNFWNNVVLGVYQNEELLSRFDDDQKVASELSRLIFKTSGLSAGYDRDDYTIDELREFANQGFVRALNQDASLDQELLNQVSLVTSKIITLLTQITGTAITGQENKVIIVSYGNSSIIVKKALDSLSLLSNYEENWSNRLAHLALGSDQISSKFPSRKVILKFPSAAIHRGDVNDNSEHTITNFLEKNIRTKSSISRWIVSILNSANISIPYVLHNDTDLFKRFYLESFMVFKGPADGPMLQYLNGFDPNGPLFQDLSEPIFNFYDFSLSSLATKLPSNCRDFGVNFLSGATPSFSFDESGTPIFEKVLSSTVHMVEGKKIHSIRDIELILPPIETISSEKGLYLPNDRIFGESLIESNRRPASFDFSDQDGDGTIRKDEIFKVRWYVSDTYGTRAVETDKDSGKYLGVLMEDFKDAEFMTRVEVHDIYGGINLSDPFKIKVEGCKNSECCFEDEIYHEKMDTNLGLIQQCIKCDSRYGGFLDSSSVSCLYTPMNLNDKSSESMTQIENYFNYCDEWNKARLDGSGVGIPLEISTTIDAKLEYTCGPDQVKGQNTVVVGTAYCSVDPSNQENMIKTFKPEDSASYLATCGSYSVEVTVESIPEQI